MDGWMDRWIDRKPTLNQQDTPVGPVWQAGWDNRPLSSSHQVLRAPARQLVRGSIFGTLVPNFAETNRDTVGPVGMQSRTLGPCSAATHSILIPVMERLRIGIAQSEGQQWELEGAFVRGHLASSHEWNVPSRNSHRRTGAEPSGSSYHKCQLGATLQAPVQATPDR
jgi:hypothetical protein